MSVHSLISAVRDYLSASEPAWDCLDAADGAALRERAVAARRRLREVIAGVEASDEHQKPFRRVLVAVDKSEQSDWATGLAASLATDLGLDVALLHVADTAMGFSPELEFADEEFQSAERPSPEYLLDRAEAKLPTAVWRRRIVKAGDPAGEIVATANSCGADLLILGTHARGRLARSLLGSTTDGVVRTAHCPVLTLAHERQPARDN